ncbi:MAG: indolepyruvate oxidoreductase subunit beta family protein [Alphaproteobacteria bacterium]|nr:indolepyruvate oxidoreductase subunit beta family protein [Alphaproteobacteria bacterium]
MDAAPARVRPLAVAIHALGGEGGGVLADWLVDLAEHGGYLAQATSVPGVAQRTGATIYYVELFPRAAAEQAGRAPVLALMPAPGDVDVVVASELMEAARAVQRGFVTPDRTLLIASTHRSYAMTEKLALADGRADSAALLESCRQAARALVAFDMAAIAEATRSVISAVLLGALAGSGALPFPRADFEAAIRRGGIGVGASLAAFAAGFDAARRGGATMPAAVEAAATRAPSAGRVRLPAWAETLPPECRDPIRLGIERTLDYQDADYARDYAGRLEPIHALEARRGDGSLRLLAETARQLALAMAYEDTFRVAELKTRPARFARVRDELGVTDGQILEIAEYFHPRTQEIADTLPAGLGAWLLRTAWAREAVDRFTARGRTVRTTSLAGFLPLHLLARFKRWRRRSLRFAAEQADIAAWLAAVAKCAEADYALAVELARARGLVKGYGDTHARGRARFARLMDMARRLQGQPAGAQRFAALHRAALADETGEALDRAIAGLDRSRSPTA